MKKIKTTESSASDRFRYPELPEVSELTGKVCEDSRPYYVSCAICRGHNNIIAFKEKYVCMKCVKLIRSRN